MMELFENEPDCDCVASLDRLADAVVKALNDNALRQLIALQANTEMQQWINELSDRANEGQLSDVERAEYRSMIATAGVIAMLQAKARTVLGETTPR